MPAEVTHFEVATTSNAPAQMWPTPAGATEPDTYCEDEADRLQATVVRTAPVHRCLRKAVATALTTAYVALGQDWRKEAEVHYPELFIEVPGEASPLAIIR
ncbi:hypothetical protein [Hymenobacter wooponensis]|uniref:Uncharacterized protein n=1 Tax=Hymenobacter wooponensis TaxID=1525360 RepID=A0A4Z0MT30_9BACT|nr:hypothetical protein [Hymenobacter wooponensis]TGD82841.1 hypothetical protein EU557_03405 [Hymenobacter wooponensis]